MIEPKLIADFDTGDGEWTYRADVIRDGEVIESFTIVTSAGGATAIFYFLETVPAWPADRLKIWRLP